MARSQPNLLEMGLCSVAFEDEAQDDSSEAGGLSGSSVEGGSVDGEVVMRAAVSDSNLIDEADVKTLKVLYQITTTSYRESGYKVYIYCQITDQCSGVAGWKSLFRSYILFHLRKKFVDLTNARFLIITKSTFWKYKSINYSMSVILRR